MAGFSRLAQNVKVRSLLATSKEDTMNIRNAIRTAASKVTTVAKIGVTTLGYVGATGIVAGMRAGKAAQGAVVEATGALHSYVADVRAAQEAGRLIAAEMAAEQQRINRHYAEVDVINAIAAELGQAVAALWESVDYMHQGGAHLSVGEQLERLLRNGRELGTLRSQVQILRNDAERLELQPLVVACGSAIDDLRNLEGNLDSLLDNARAAWNALEERAADRAKVFAAFES